MPPVQALGSLCRCTASSSSPGCVHRTWGARTPPARGGSDEDSDPSYRGFVAADDGAPCLQGVRLLCPERVHAARGPGQRTLSGYMERCSPPKCGLPAESIEVEPSSNEEAESEDEAQPRQQRQGRQAATGRSKARPPARSKRRSSADAWREPSSPAAGEQPSSGRPSTRSQARSRATGRQALRKRRLAVESGSASAGAESESDTTEGSKGASPQQAQARTPASQAQGLKRIRRAGTGGSAPAASPCQGPAQAAPAATAPAAAAAAAAGPSAPARPQRCGTFWCLACGRDTHILGRAPGASTRVQGPQLACAHCGVCSFDLAAG